MRKRRADLNTQPMKRPAVARRNLSLQCLFAVGLSLLALALSGAPGSASPAGNSLLQRAGVADDATSFSGTLTSLVYTSDRAESTVVNIDHLAPSQWRIWYVAPADAYGRLIISNEAVTYQYEPSANKVYS